MGHRNCVKWLAFKAEYHEVKRDQGTNGMAYESLTA
jgi:hypothetical protein